MTTIEIAQAVAQPFLKEAAAAERLGLSPKTLRNWRSRGEGPPYLLLGSSVRYATASVDAWAHSRVAA